MAEECLKIAKAVKSIRHPIAYDVAFPLVMNTTIVAQNERGTLLEGETVPMPVCPAAFCSRNIV